MKNLFKKKLPVIIITIISYSIISCSPNVDSHVHSFNSEWSSDSSHHWHAVTCEHSELVKDMELHTFGEWVLNDDATPETDGTKTRICSKCDYVQTISITGTKTFNWYETPVDAVTGGPVTKDTTYVYFGVYPQTVLPIDYSVIIDETDFVKMGGLTYYKGINKDNDVVYYAKADENYYLYANSYLHEEYSDGSEITGETYRYFKVEPIKWKVLTTDYNGKALLLATNKYVVNFPFYSGLDSRKIDGKNICFNDYKYSEIRAFLNGLSFYSGIDYKGNLISENRWVGKGFIQNVFTESAQKNIEETELDNTPEVEDPDYYEYETNPYIYESTKDKVFLLSASEIRNTEYNFAKIDSSDKTPLEVETDYAKALAESTWYYNLWLRTARADSDEFVYTVNNCFGQYSIDYYNSSVDDHANVSFLPALCIDIQ